MKYFYKLLAIICVVFVVNAFAETSIKPEAEYTEKNTNFLVAATAPQFTIKLKSNPTTGYSWFLRDYDTHLIKLVKHQYVAGANKKMIGAGGYELWTFRVLPAGFIAPQQTLVRLVYSRPWEGAETGTQLVFSVSTALN